MKAHEIFLIGGEDDERATFVEEETDDGRCKLTCGYRGKVASSIAGDFFEALCEVRVQLERESLIPFCYGASLSVYPSGTARRMAAGRLAYQLQVGRHPGEGDLREIFAEGPDVVPVTVALQRQYFDEWAASGRT
ncbi:MAG: hypothetical protein EON54_10885 [Alcaligenaceae bacterium]|nr:MAG: hypothetical protein EON54_10885 [Alcaligenaceae bacterium]